MFGITGCRRGSATGLALPVNSRELMLTGLNAVRIEYYSNCIPANISSRERAGQYRLSCQLGREAEKQ